MNISQIHKKLEDITKKERKAFPTHSVIDSYLDMTQMEVFEMYYEVYGLGQSTKDALDPFKAKYEFTNSTSVGGIVLLPNDYLHLNGGGYTLTYDNIAKVSRKHNITFPNEDAFIDALNSQVRPVSITYPLGTMSDGEIQLYPQVPQVGVINYFKRPIPPQFVYTESGVNGRTITYDAVNSVQLQWNESYLNKIMIKTLEYLGITYSDGELIQFGELKNKTV